MHSSGLFLSCSVQVDLLAPTKITGIITQGAKDFGHVQFVGSYKLAYSNDGEHWIIYQDDKQKKDKVKQTEDCISVALLQRTTSVVTPVL